MRKSRFNEIVFRGLVHLLTYKGEQKVTPRHLW